MKNDEFYIENVFASGRIEDLVKDVEVGDYVKVILVLNEAIDNIEAERLWFRVLRMNDDFTILIELDNDPMYINSIQDKDQLIITRQNILEVMK